MVITTLIYFSLPPTEPIRSQQLPRILQATRQTEIQLSARRVGQSCRLSRGHLSHCQIHNTKFAGKRLGAQFRGWGYTIDIEMEIVLVGHFVFQSGEKFGGESAMFGHAWKRTKGSVLKLIRSLSLSDTILYCVSPQDIRSSEVPVGA